PIGPHRVPQPPERLRVGAAARRGEVRLGEERVDRLSQEQAGARGPAVTAEQAAAPCSSQGMRRLDRKPRRRESRWLLARTGGEVAGNGPFPATPYEPARTPNPFTCGPQPGRALPLALLDRRAAAAARKLTAGPC